MPVTAIISKKDIIDIGPAPWARFSGVCHFLSVHLGVRLPVCRHRCSGRLDVCHRGPFSLGRTQSAETEFKLLNHLFQSFREISPLSMPTLQTAPFWAFHRLTNCSNHASFSGLPTNQQRIFPSMINDIPFHRKSSLLLVNFPPLGVNQTGTFISTRV
jgi:hypothetical protein